MSIGSGTKLGPYEVQDFIGQGAMGVVYRAYHSELERAGALKVMQAITPDPDTVARFRHEAQAIARLRHPNIVDVYDFGEFEGSPYMIVEYVPGGSLAARMTRERLDPDAVIRYLHGIAAGLDYAHAHGVVHRDVKPANVLLAADDSPVLADFGLAKLLQGSSLKSMTGATTGTPAYMAPEQVTAAQVGPAADRYSLATMAYEMLTGVIPFDGGGLMELLYAQVHRYPSPPSARRADLGPQVDEVIMRGLAKNPADRWESCGAFVEALEAALEKAPAASVGSTLVMPAPASDAVHVNGVPVAPIPAASPAPKRNRRRLFIGVAASLVLLLVLGVCAIAAQATTLTVNPGRASPGDTVTVTATHVPANQVGEIQLWSAVRAYPFHADASGAVTRQITLPLDIELGDHVVKICWDGSCHKQAPLRVVESAAESVPVSTPGYPTGVSPSPTSVPTSGSTSRGTPTPGPSVTLTSLSQLGQTRVVFHYFSGGTTSVYVCQNGTCHSAGNVTVGAGANVPVSFKTPSGVLLAPLGGKAYVATSCCGFTNSLAVSA